MDRSVLLTPRILILAIALVSSPAALAQGTPGTGAAATAAGGQSGSVKPVIIDAKNHSLIITTSPSNHRKIQVLLARLTQDPDQGKDIRSKVFHLMTLSQQEFFNLVKYNLPGFDPTQQERVMLTPESRNRLLVENKNVPDRYLLPSPPAPNIGALGGSH